MEDVTRAFQRMREQQRMNIAKSFGYEDDTLGKVKEEIIKGLQSENPFERELAEQRLEKAGFSDIEKSDIMDAISYDSEFKFKKSGKEVKEQIKNVILPTKQAELEAKKNEANSLLAQCGEAPKHDVCRWWLNNLDMECGYKTYCWEECREMRDDCGEVAISVDYRDNAEMKCNCAKDKDEAKARREYNECVEIICRIMVDIKACELLDNNLKDTDEFKMSVRQMAAFKFV